MTLASCVLFRWLLTPAPGDEAGGTKCFGFSPSIVLGEILWLCFHLEGPNLRATRIFFGRRKARYKISAQDRLGAAGPLTAGEEAEQHLADGGD